MIDQSNMKFLSEAAWEYGAEWLADANSVFVMIDLCGGLSRCQGDQCLTWAVHSLK